MLKSNILKVTPTAIEQAALEHLKCPICYEFPESKVYQCKNGHPVCATCCGAVKTCPQCRVPFEEERIRNLAFEMLLKRMKVQCSYSVDGCPLLLLRQELAGHVKFCDFRPIDFCHLLGFKHCMFVSSQPDAIFRHLKSEHKVGRISGRKPVVTKTIQNFGSLISNLAGANDSVVGVSIKTWKFNFGDKHATKFVVCRTVNAQRQDFSLACFLVGDSAAKSGLYQVNIAVWTVLDSKTQDLRWKWASEPTPFKYAKSYLENPPFRFHLPYLTERVGGRKDYDLKMEICISKKEPIPI